MVDEPRNPKPYETLLAQTSWLGRLAAQLVPAADREDLVQDVLLSAMRRQGEPTHQRGWLATVARNLAARRRVRDQNRRAREQAVAHHNLGQNAEPAAADAVASFAIHQAVVNAVMDLEEPYRTAVLLRFWEDLPPREVAARTGVPVETARTRIKRGVDRLRAQLDRQQGGRAAWAGALLQIGAVQEVLLAGSTAAGSAAAGSAAAGTTASVPILSGVLAMKKTALACAAAALALASVAMFAFEWGNPQAGATTGGEASPVAAGGGPPFAGSPTGPAQQARDNARVEVPATTTGSGTVRVRVRYHDNTPASDVGVFLRNRNGTALGVEQRTAADGTTIFPDLVAGDYRVLVHRVRLQPGNEKNIAVLAGQQSDCDLRIARGVTVHGRVVTMRPDEQPVAGARVYAFQQQHQDLMAFLAETNAEGSFVLRDVAPGLDLYARADGWQPTGRRHCRRVQGRPGDVVQAQIQLGARGYGLRGQILDPHGQPAPRAWVGIAVDEDCRKYIDGLKKVRAADGNKMLDREAFLIRADEEGRFATTEVPFGDVAVLARGAGNQEHLVGGARVRVEKGRTNQVAVHLHTGGTIFGTVRDEKGQAYPGITLQTEFRGTVELGELERGFGPLLADRNCVTAVDGSYRIEGLFAAEHRLSRLLPTDDQHIRLVQVSAGQETRVDLTVPRTWQLRVVVQDMQGSPLEGWAVMLSGRGSIPYRLVDKVRTGADGVHVAKGLRAERYVLSVHAPDPKGNRPVRRFPCFLKTVTRGETQVVARVSPPTGVIRGRVVDSNGIPPARVRVNYTLAGFQETEQVKTDADGRFEIPRLPAGELRLEVHATGLPRISTDVTLSSGETRELGDVTLPAPAWLEVELSSEDGKEIDTRDIWLSRQGVTTHDPWRELPKVAQLRRRKGETLWRHRAVKAGDYVLHVAGDDFASIVREVRLVPGTPQRLKVTVPRGVVQEFIITLADPVHGKRGEGYGWLVFRDLQNRYLLKHHFQGPIPDPSQLILRTKVHLLPGRYRVSARSRGGRAETTVQVPEGGGPPIRIIVL